MVAPNAWLKMKKPLDYKIGFFKFNEGFALQCQIKDWTTLTEWSIFTDIVCICHIFDIEKKNFSCNFELNFHRFLNH